MASNFQRPQLGQASLRQAQIGNAPTVDRQAHAEADQASANIDSLNRIGQTVIKKVSDADKARDINEARRATANLPSEVDRRVRRQAEENGIPYRRLSNEELNSYTTQALGEFYDESGISDSAYRQEAMQMGDELGIRSLAKFGQVRDAENLKYNTGVITERTSVQANVLHKGGMTEEAFIKTLGNDLELDGVALGTESQAKVAQLEGILADVVANGNPEAISILDSEDAKEYFDGVEGYDNMVQIGKNKSIAVVNKKSAQNFTAIEERVFAIANGGGFSSASEVKSILEEELSQYKGTLYEPSEKKMFKLEQQLLKMAETNGHLEGYQNAKLNKDSTYLKNLGLKPKELEAVITQDAKYGIGVNDFTPETLKNLSDGQLGSLSKYSGEGLPFPKQMRIWANETPLGGFEGAKQKYLTFNRLASATGSRVNEIFDKKTMMEMSFMGRLVANGAVEESVKEEQLAEYRSNMSKNVDSYGNYASADSLLVLRDKEVQADIQDFAKDAPWTTDDSSSSAYVARNVSGSIGMYIASGYSNEEAITKSKELFNNTHQHVEMPDGSETVITPEFKQAMLDNKSTLDDLVLYASRQSGVIAANKVQTIFNGATEGGTFKEDAMDNISVRPVNNYEKTKEYQIFYDGKLVPNSRFNADSYTKGLSEIKTNDRLKIEANAPNNKNK